MEINENAREKNEERRKLIETMNKEKKAKKEKQI